MDPTSISSPSSRTPPTIRPNASPYSVRTTRTSSSGWLTLTISDDGEGFALETVAQGHQLGIEGLRERAEMIEANLEIESQAGQGTTVRLIWNEKP